jgi:5,5'-dehydrodivanillate O-demethylase
MQSFPSQDQMAWETQGPIADRTKEHLGESDRGVILFRKLLRDQIHAVQSGADPVGVSRALERDEVIRLIPEGFTAFSSTAEQR